MACDLEKVLRLYIAKKNTNLAKDIRSKLEEFETINDQSNRTSGLSGGALGADIEWSKEGEQYGVQFTHFYHGERSNKNAPHGNTAITARDFREGKTKAAEAAKLNWGYDYDTMKDPRLIRNWSQVKHSDAIFAIAPIAKKGDKLFPNQKNDSRVANFDGAVKGGTGYAVGMAILKQEPIYVFDDGQTNKWHKWDYNQQKMIEISTPKLTKNFAGIGTRHITPAGKQAIKDVYANTFNKQQQSDNSINIWSTDKNGYEKLSNLNTDPINIKGKVFTNVEAMYQYSKAMFAGDIITANKILNLKPGWNNKSETGLSKNLTAGYAAQQLGRQVKNLDKEAWDKVSSEKLKQAMQIYYKHNTEAAKLLLSTGNKQLTHTQANKSKWGEEFPKILMEIRTELQSNNSNESLKNNQQDKVANTNDKNTDYEYLNKEDTDTIQDILDNKMKDC